MIKLNAAQAALFGFIMVAAFAFGGCSKAKQLASSSSLLGTPTQEGLAAGGTATLNENGIATGQKVTCDEQGVCKGKVQL